MTPSGTPPNSITKPHSPTCSPSSSLPCSPFKAFRPLCELIQSLPDHVRLQIVDNLSNSSFKDLKALTRLSQDSYDRYAPILYKRLHIKSYDAPIKMKLMNPKNRKGYHPFTEEDENAYKKYKERRMGIMEFCESLRFVSENDIRASLGLVCEFAHHQEQGERVFENVQYLMFQGKGSIVKREIGYKDNNKVYSSRYLWRNLNPTHVCVDNPPVFDPRLSPRQSTMERCLYYMHSGDSDTHWTNI
ncbi:hypothetical protein V866_007959 [Kwoniella sp. B9012]